MELTYIGPTLEVDKLRHAEFGVQIDRGKYKSTGDKLLQKGCVVRVT